MTISPERLRPLLRSLLVSRFRLAFPRETNELTGYALIMAKSGPRLHLSTGTPAHSTDWGRGRINGTAITVAEFARVLETQLDRLVVDDSGIQGIFHFHLTWMPDQASDISGPSLFTALQEQLGLRLESKKVPGEVLVIDRIERPTGN